MNKSLLLSVLLRYCTINNLKFTKSYEAHAYSIEAYHRKYRIIRYNHDRSWDTPFGEKWYNGNQLYDMLEFVCTTAYNNEIEKRRGISLENTNISA